MDGDLSLQSKLNTHCDYLTRGELFGIFSWDKYLTVFSLDKEQEGQPYGPLLCTFFLQKYF